MLGNGLSLVDLMQLLNAIRQKDLILQVKIIDGPWEELSQNVLLAMIQVVTTGKISLGNEIRLRLLHKE
jgi:hypothetical protein